MLKWVIQSCDVVVSMVMYSRQFECVRRVFTSMQHKLKWQNESESQHISLPGGSVIGLQMFSMLLEPRVCFGGQVLEGWQADVGDL